MNLIDFAVTAKGGPGRTRAFTDEMYSIELRTGIQSRATKNSKIWVVLQGGDDGKVESPKRWLKGGQLQPGTNDLYEIMFTSEKLVGILSKLVIGYDNPDTDTGWFLDYVSRTKTA